MPASCNIEGQTWSQMPEETLRESPARMNEPWSRWWRRNSGLRFTQIWPDVVLRWPRLTRLGSLVATHADLGLGQSKRCNGQRAGWGEGLEGSRPWQGSRAVAGTCSWMRPGGKGVNVGEGEQEGSGDKERQWEEKQEWLMGQKNLMAVAETNGDGGALEWFLLPAHLQVLEPWGLGGFGAHCRYIRGLDPGFPGLLGAVGGMAAKRQGRSRVQSPPPLALAEQPQGQLAPSLPSSSLFHLRTHQSRASSPTGPANSHQETSSVQSCNAAPSWAEVSLDAPWPVIGDRALMEGEGHPSQRRESSTCTWSGIRVNLLCHPRQLAVVNTEGPRWLRVSTGLPVACWSRYSGV